MTRMADADAQPMKLAVTDMTHDVAQAILAAMAAVELQPRRARRQVQIVMRDQALLRVDFVKAQSRCDGNAAFVHERGRFEQPDRIIADAYLTSFAVQLAIAAKHRVFVPSQGINVPEPGVVPGS